MTGPLGALLLFLSLTEWTVSALKYNASLDTYNLNKNQDAEQITDYSTPRLDSYFPSPDNWRSKPCYTLLLDKWMNAQPENDDYFKTLHEYDWRETQMRAGGDARGLASDRSLDYLESMGYKCVYIAGTPFLNMPWQADGYSAIDFSLLDPHYGTMEDWQYLVQRLHSRGIYFIADFTVGTMGDMLGFVGHLNSSTPWRIEEYEVQWKRPPYAPWGFDYYPDFEYSNEYNYSCQYPTFYLENGDIWDVGKVGCYASNFDQYGDIEAFGVFPDWQRQLAKFASVQDRLREWQPHVSQRIKVFGCMAIEALDIDGIRIDKATQVTVDFMADWSEHTRKCARDNFGKSNFFIPGEITGGDTFGALYVGRGRLPAMRPGSPQDSLALRTNSSGVFIRDPEFSGLDGSAFHYSIYRNIARFLGQDGNLNVAYDIPVNFVDAWVHMMSSNDFINVMTNKFDPRHQYGTTNQDVFRWPGIVNGTQKQQLGQFICNLLLPGQPLLWYGEEQAMYVLDNGAANYLYGRQSMVSNQAWQRHACYKLGSEQYYNMHWDKALSGCDDDWNSLDHFDPTAEPMRGIRNQLWLRTQYPALQDGFDVAKFGNWTTWIQLPGSNGTGTEIGMWAAVRRPFKYQVSVGNEWGFQSAANSSTDDGRVLDAVWLLYTNENYTRTHAFGCTDQDHIRAPFSVPTTGGTTTIKNLIYPYEELTLQASTDSFYDNNEAPYTGCLPSITMQPYDYKVFVPLARWRQQPPSMTHFSPGHDARIVRTGDTIDIAIEFDHEMNCDSMNSAISIVNFAGTAGANPQIAQGACAPIASGDQPKPTINGAGPSAWRWTSQITGAADGIYDIRVTSVDMEGVQGVNSNATAHLIIRAGQSDNPVVFPKTADYSDTLLTSSGGKYSLNNTAPGAQLLRYSGNFGQTWSDWVPYQQTMEMDGLTFENNWWKGAHVIVQYYSNLTHSAQHIQHGDIDYTGARRRYPQLLARGLFNNWGYDLGAFASFQNKEDSVWRMPLSASWPSFIQLNVWDYDDYFYGDQDGDGIIDRLPPNALSPNFMNMSEPPAPHLSWEIYVNDLTGQWSVEPIGTESVTIIGFALLVAIPILTAFIAAAIFRYSFYSIKVNKWGLKPNKSEKSYFPILGGGGEKKEKMDEKAVVSSSKKPERIIGWPEDPSKRRKVLIATLEYEIIDWKLKVKIGGLGVMSTLMGKAMTDVDLIWVIPKVQDIDYPQGEYAEPIEVTIFGEPYLIEVETHQLDNITYIILDSPVFRAQTKSDPYPQRMDDLSSAIFYSTWNQAIAETVRRFPDIDIYHINDYHGALAPLYLLPKVLPVCLSLHNAEFQGLWPLRTKEEMKEVCAAFNISKDVCSKYVQFGNTFNLLHAAASFISIHQKSVGVAGVSDKYGKRSWARYPALWTLRNIDSLPNPDPTDIAALDEQPLAVNKIEIDTEAESKRPEQKRQAQEWAGIKQDPTADLFVFVGRWSKQKGVDLIADVMPSLLDKKPKIQLICVGPVIDLYGRFAAEKLARLMEMYPDRVFSKPEFTALPPYLFSGADFALIPSRDEPFGLVAVEFGRKGALGVGARLGGLGLMPGWWFPVESSATKHMLSQLTKTIRLALKSTEQERAMLRARSAVQRFPVVEWRQRLEDFQRRSIATSRSNAAENAWGADMAGLGAAPGGFYSQDAGSNASLARPGSPDSMMSNRRSSVPQMPPMNMDQPMANDNLSPGTGYHDRFKQRNQNRQSAESFYDEDPNAEPLYYGDKRRSKKFFAGGGDDDSSINSSDRGGESSAASMNYNPNNRGGAGGQGYDSFLAAANKQFAKTSGNRNAPDPYFDPRASGTGDNFMPSRPFSIHSRVSSFDSISSIVDEKNASPLNKQLDSFTDSDGEVAQNFVQKLRDLNAGNSMNDMCIEKFLMKSEKQFFSEIKKEKMAQAPSLRSRDSFMQSHPASMMDGYRPESPYQHSYSGHGHDDHNFGDYDEPLTDKPLSRLEVFMQRSIFGWPLYTIIIALGQLLSATSFQLSLLGGSNTLKEVDLYIVCSIFVVATVAWYTIFRMLPSVWVLSLPWLAFGFAFALVGFPSIGGIFLGPRLIITRVATWTYAVASAAGFLQFGLNFGEEAGAATEVWIMRACIVQGLQQIWVSALWYWGYTLNGEDPTTYVPPRAICYVVFPLSAMSFAFGALLFKGLPEYYRQIPPYVPNFFKTLLRRKLVLWFWISEILRSYWLSGPYGRNWQFLWSAIGIPLWSIVVMIIIFFIGIWGLLMGILIKYAKVHSWLLPVFAVGLGAPRWCQMWWGTSGMGLYLPWAGVAGPYVSTCLWLWLGVLDALQGVGLGMILLQTLSRLHVCATLAAAQLIGSIVVMIARATSPSKVGPGNVFPNPAIWNPSTGENNPFIHWEFWLALACQIVIVFGYFFFFRKEQLSKP